MLCVIGLAILVLNLLVITQSDVDTHPRMDAAPPVPNAERRVRIEDLYIASGPPNPVIAPNGKGY